jgi:small subunit ribosomal protein S4
MARYRGSRVKIVRRFGILPGFTTKLDSKKGNNFSNSRKLSQYGLHLHEKQKLRYNYGITEHQLLHYVKLARKRKGNTGNVLLEILEMRLDNIIYRSGLTPTISAARQLISHGHVFINKRKVTIPSYLCQISTKITINKSSLPESKAYSNIPKYLLVNGNNSEQIDIEIINTPNVQSLGFPINILLVLEYYSGR